jgi:hypothetical protein
VQLGLASSSKDWAVQLLVDFATIYPDSVLIAVVVQHSSTTADYFAIGGHIDEIPVKADHAPHFFRIGTRLDQRVQRADEPKKCPPCVSGRENWA